MEITERRSAVLYVTAAGTIGNLTSFLVSVSSTYNWFHHLYSLSQTGELFTDRSRDIESALKTLEVYPSEELAVSSIKIGSPGFWEFVGNLNPLNCLVDVLKLILEWRDRNADRKIEIDRLNLEKATSYLELIQQIDKIFAKYERSPNSFRRFINGNMERFVLELERNVLPMLDPKAPPKLLEPKKRPQIYVELKDLAKGRSKEIPGFIVNVLNPKHEKLRDLGLLAFVAEHQAKMSMEDLQKGINGLIDMGFVEFDPDENKVTPTDQGRQFFATIQKDTNNRKE